MSSSKDDRRRWIAVEVSLFDDPLFDGEPLTRREALLWLYANVAWRETRHRICGMTLPVPIGSIFITLRALQKIWGWKSDTRVRTFLKEMEREGKICVKVDAGKTFISVCDLNVIRTDKRQENASGTQPKRGGNALKTPDYQDSKKERMRADACDFDGFEVWFETYPTSAHDNREAAAAEWRKLSAAVRHRVIEETPAYFEDAVAQGRTFPPSAANFLIGRYWERKRKPQPTGKQKSPGRQTVCKLAPVAAASAAPKTREEMVRGHLQHNSKPWDGQSSNLGNPSRFLENYKQKLRQTPVLDMPCEPGVIVQRDRLVEA